MITLEQVEKLKERANVSYEDAKEALEATGGDLLDAVIFLEKQGKVHAPQTRAYNTQTGAYQDGRRPDAQGRQWDGANGDQRQGPTFSDYMRAFWHQFCALVRKTNANQFEVIKDGRCIVSMPVTLLILALLFFFWVSIPLLIIGLFFDCRYRFCGPDIGGRDINSFMEQAADTADSIKRTAKMHEEEAKQADHD